jgi:hypothetical protein
MEDLARVVMLMFLGVLALGAVTAALAVWQWVRPSAAKQVTVMALTALCGIAGLFLGVQASWLFGSPLLIAGALGVLSVFRSAGR